MMAIGFLLTPFIVHEIGLPAFGMWAVVGSLAGYLGLLDFGLGGAFVKFISEFIELDRRDAARQVLTFGLFFYAGFGLLLAIPVLSCGWWIVHLFKMPAAQYPQALQVFEALFGILVLSIVAGLPGSALVAMQRIDLASRNNFIGYLSYALSTVLFLRAGYGIWGVIGGQAVQIVFIAILQYITARRIFGPLWHHPLRIERKIVRRMFSFGGWTQLTSILNIVSLDVGRFISAAVVSVTSVGYYEIGSKLSFFTRSLPAYLLDAILPAAAAAEARGDRESVERLYRKGTMYSMLVTCAIGGFLFATSDSLVQIWMGRSFPYVGAIICWLSVGYAVSGMTGVGTTVLRAAGIPQVETRFTAVTSAVNLLSTLVLVRVDGIIGVAAGTAIGWSVGTIDFLIIYHRIRGTNWWAEVGSRLVRLVAANAVAVGALWRVTALLPQSVLDNRFIGLAALALLGIAYLAVFGLVTVVLGVWRKDDARLLRQATRSSWARTSSLLAFTRGGA